MSYCPICGHQAEPDGQLQCECNDGERNKMSNTPRTDAKWSCVGMVSDPADVMADFARQLERELAAYKTALELIADHGGIYSGGKTLNGLWCADVARRALEETK
jgi:hypothetical protein